MVMAADSNNRQQAGPSSSSRGGDAAASSSRPSSSAAASQQQHEAALGGRYELVCARGKGSFAKVWEARHRRTGLKVAIKVISHAKMAAKILEAHHGRGRGLPLSPSAAAAAADKRIATEIRVMRLLQSRAHHPHVIRFYEAMSTQRHTYIVMELADAGQLWDHVVLQGRLPEDHARAIFRQLAAAVLFCHRNMVAHRDLKMENVLLVNVTGGGHDMEEVAGVKVVDFGFSKVYREGKAMRKQLGSREYAAPELYAGAGYVGPQVDVWSCGVILYGMLCGGLPFDGGDDASELARKIRRGEYRRLPSWVSDDARDLIAGMLIVRPSKRATMAEVMAHRWLHPDTMPAYLLAMPSPVLDAEDTAAADMVDEAAVEQLVTRHGFDRSSLLESLSQSHLHRQQQEADEAAVAYQLVLAAISDAPTRYLSSMSMRRRQQSSPPSQQHQRWALGGLLDGGGVVLHDCPRLTMQRIAAALQDLGIPIVAYHRRRHRIECRADVVVPVPAAIGADDGGLQRNNDILDSMSAAVFFEIQVYKQTTGEHHQRQQHADPQSSYVVHLKRTSGPQLPYLTICSQLSSRLRRPHNNII